MPFDTGIFEWLIIFVIALLVLGPERLPKAARTVGRWFGKAKSTMTQFNHQINRELEIDELKKRVAEHEKLIKEQAADTELEILREEAEQTLQQAEERLKSKE
ncbi:Sec-independent protein translocase protein TatB [Kangiella sp. HZ709]|uniref:Sec-independent protein translocase protein TatB n=1 Tax=Kangiella sp. HZ709 TaxID=2666328 RepID=UPI0012AFCD2D|nr:Sec-independent protein translocase protein TatB [Kangiella sp. HZ709]MRX28257.1 twin-arginine translocase subunit TatB [Kangiella sp. HZ709]